MSGTTVSAYRPSARGGLIWALILLAWAAILAALMLRGSLTTFLHPRMTAFVIGAIAGFAILGLTTLLLALRGRGLSSPRPGYAIFLIPLILLAAGGVQPLHETSTTMRIIKTAPRSNASSPEYNNVQEYLASLGSEEVINMTDSLYVPLVAAFSADPQGFHNRRVELTGFAFRHQTTPAQHLYLIRFLITCCVADAEPVGLLVHGQELDAVENFSWLRLQGTLQASLAPDPYSGAQRLVPVIRVDRFQIVDAPTVQYLYP